MTISSNQKSTEHKELALLYQTSVDELAMFKKHQWMVAHFGFLLYVAVVIVACKLWPYTLSTYINFFGFFITAGITYFIYDRSYSFIKRLSKSIEDRKN